jgi:hypothetical protein
MEKMISRNEIEEKIEWEVSREPVKQAMEPEKEVESLFNVEEIEAI